MARAYLGLGSNKGDRLGFLREAFRGLRSIEGVEVVSWSSIYETSPFGFREQDDFLNAAVGVETDLTPERLLAEVRMLETRAGRTPSRHWGPREIDIDLLLHGEFRLNSGSLVVPHPGLPDRRFVLVPLAEIAGETVDPVTHRTISALLAACSDNGTVIRTPWSLQPEQQEHSLARSK